MQDIWIMVFKLVLKYEVSFWERWLYKSKCNVAFFVLFSIPIFLIIYVSFNIEFLTIISSADSHWTEID